MTCPHYEARRTLYDPDLCRYWHSSGTDYKGDWYPGHCTHREVMVATCYAGRLWRQDNDDDGGGIKCCGTS